MTETEFERLAKRVARGDWQRQQLLQLLTRGEIPAVPHLRGTAKSFQSKYTRSLANMIERLSQERAVLRVPARAGKRWTSVYRLAD